MCSLAADFPVHRLEGTSFLLMPLGIWSVFFLFQIFPFFFWGVRAVFILFSKISTCFIHFLLLTLKAFNAVNFTSADSFDYVLFFIIF